MNSACASRKRRKPRIPADVQVGAFGELGDWKVLRAAYRLGTLPDGWQAVPDLDADTFLEAGQAFVGANFSHGWAVRDADKTRVVTFGVAAGPAVLVGDAIWHPKVSARAKVETAMALFEALRRNMALLVMSKLKDKRFYEWLVDAGALRRVGSLYDIYAPGERIALFQSRSGEVKR